MITTCNDDFNKNYHLLNSKCQTDQNIKDYFKNYMIEMRIVFQQIDFSAFNSLPI